MGKANSTLQKVGENDNARAVYAAHLSSPELNAIIIIRNRAISQSKYACKSSG